MRIENLPTEILISVFCCYAKNARIKDINNLSLVCKHWNNLSKDNYIWHTIYETIFSVKLNISINCNIQLRKILALHKKYGGKFYHNNFSGMNALHLSTSDRWNCCDTLNTLINHGMNPRETNYAGQTPLHTAIEYQNDNAVSFLLNIDIGLLEMDDFQGKKPLHIAAAKGNYDICLKLLRDGASPVVLDNQRQTPLHYAAKNGHVRVCRLLASLYGRYNIELNDANGNTALLLAASTNKLDCVRILIDEFYANLNASDRKGRTVMDSISRLMDNSAIKWAKEHQIWKSCSSHYVNDSDEWDRIAVRDQRNQFINAHANQLFVHYH